MLGKGRYVLHVVYAGFDVKHRYVEKVVLCMQGTVAMATRHMQEAASAFKTQHGVLLKFVRGNAARTSGAENDMEAYANLLNLNNYYE